MLRQYLQRKSVAAVAMTPPPVKPEYERLYCFSIIENQRWWLHKGWSHSLLQHDRPAWSDEYQEPTPSISEFTLPPPVHNCQWTWVDPEWKLDKRDDDVGGWRYGDWSNNTLLTRRRRWWRCARLERHEVANEVDTPVPKRSSAISFRSNKSASRGSVHSDMSISSSLSSSLDSMNSPTKGFGGGGPSYRFSPKPRPTSLLTHRSVSSISTITTVSPSSSPSSYKSHFWLNR
ncbi:hypothetical protein BCR43DRAFT_502652 [Syncephalastrum racemosum]|uniref:Peroxin/Ferlin domain-containing protein n=1 Tax=Syncephalastrum racemosum TaxID=13706 RepID=A0A1X2HNR8_SYNRA|nr:hypothetical protein BCR43DRAFT_502652 [Syncephalastrum racemosum]